MIRRFFGRFLCLIFGHNPIAIEFVFENPDKSQRRDWGDMWIMRPAANLNPFVFNLCGRCEELSRHRSREPIVAQAIAQHEAQQAQAKAAHDLAKAQERIPGESLKAFKRRTTAALAKPPSP